MTKVLSRNIGLDLVRVTEATALGAGRWLGSGNRQSAHRIATETMRRSLDNIEVNGYIVIGEEGRMGPTSPLDTGQKVGTGAGPEVDVIVDPIDGTNSVVNGFPGAISVVSVTPRGAMWPGRPAIYMEKIVVDGEVAPSLVPECLDAPVGWTLALIARAKSRQVRDLQVLVLDRPRHSYLIQEVRQAGARVILRPDGDTGNALIAATVGQGADVLMGVGGVTEGVTAACAVRALGGAMLARLAPQSVEERNIVADAGLDTKRIFTCNELITSNKIFFAATGVTDGPLLHGVRYQSNKAKTYSLVIRGETGTRRTIYAEHQNID